MLFIILGTLPPEHMSKGGFVSKTSEVTMGSQPTDIELVKRTRAGDFDAFATLYVRYARSLFRVIYAMTQDRAVAEDLLQETFFRVYRNLNRVDDSVDSLQPWLYRIAINLTNNWLTRTPKTSPLEKASEWFQRHIHISPEHMFERDERVRAVQDAIAKLDEKHRIVVVLYYLQELSLDEIAQILNLPVGTVKSRLYHARRQLRDHLQADQRIAVPKAALSAS